MANNVKSSFMTQLQRRFGQVRKLDRSQSLFEIGDGAAKVYVRYSKVHDRGETFFGLRSEDLRKLSGQASIICFLWPDQKEPLLIPLSNYEEVFRSVNPASDGQYKVQVFRKPERAEMYIANAGRFNVEGYFGWHPLQELINASTSRFVPELTHPQVQALLGGIGSAQDYDIWVPVNDRERLDWSYAHRFECRNSLPGGFKEVVDVLEEIDVIWMDRATGQPKALFEVEHSTPIYSALLRFNDIHLYASRLRPTFSVVADQTRRGLFVRQLNRLTFRASGLNENCDFLEYANVFHWYLRMSQRLSELPYHEVVGRANH